MSTYVEKQTFHQMLSGMILGFSEAEVILSCTFDLPDEKCPAQSKDHRQIQRGTQADQFRLTSDHTRGGKKE